jgi:hypothetical protein
MQTVLSVVAIVVGACAAFAGGVFGNRWLQLRERRILLMTDLIPILVAQILHAEQQVQAGIGNPVRQDMLVTAHKIHWQLVITPGKPAATARAELSRLQGLIVAATNPGIRPPGSVMTPIFADTSKPSSTFNSLWSRSCRPTASSRYRFHNFRLRPVAHQPARQLADIRYATPSHDRYRLRLRF